MPLTAMLRGLRGTGSDDLINVGGSGGADQSLWYFRAPPAFMGNQGMAYGGTLQFTLSSFSGDFSPSAMNQGVRPSVRPSTLASPHTAPRPPPTLRRLSVSTRHARLQP